MSRRWSVGLALVLTAAGWRHDGTARYPQAAPPLTWKAADATWTATLPDWGNASPVLFGTRLCTTAEPTTVVCVDAATGRPSWKATNDRLDTLPSAEAATRRSQLDALPTLEAQASAGVREMGTLRRDLRRADAPPDTADRLAKVSAALDVQRAQIDELRSWLTPPVLGMIGYASATPTTDGTRLYALTGNGVVSAFSAQGTRVWSRWLGPVAMPMRGFDYGSATSPQLVDGVLVVGHARLRGLDPATGAVRWEDPEPWNHYGTPGVARVGGASVLLLPDGRLLRARDGVVLTKDLGNINYLGPIADGDVAIWAGGRGHRGSPTENRIGAWKLAATSSGVSATRLWEREVPNAERIYSSPVLFEGRLWVLTLDNVLTTIDARTGSTLTTFDLKPMLQAEGATNDTVAYMNPTVAGRTLFLGWQPGLFVAIDPSVPPTIKGVSHFEGVTRATPLFDGATVYVRTDTRLYRFDG